MSQKYINYLWKEKIIKWKNNKIWKRTEIRTNKNEFGKNWRNSKQKNHPQEKTKGKQLIEEKQKMGNLLHKIKITREEILNFVLNNVKANINN